ncbi:type II toxin-antitoxin system PemK/MazF family toxin [Sporosarcina sp. FSL K6-3457]|uniref:type II toxin-antitoxin system PemK/MazF family toxin n=1 Tax=Sporosarcina sp. FSL K6-3457 TaxID=2978204 RepID=UPI0030F4CE0E
MRLQKYLKEKLDELEQIVLALGEKRKNMFVNWLPRHNSFLKNEATYDYSKHIVYKRGMVIHVDFGFRVGAEYGGLHWVVVIQNDAKSARTLVIVPLSSLKEGEKTHRNDAFLGVIEKLNENEAEALLGQITTISKMRIKPGPIYNLTNDQLDEIDRKIIERYVSPTMKRKLM